MAGTMVPPEDREMSQDINQPRSFWQLMEAISTQSHDKITYKEFKKNFGTDVTRLAHMPAATFVRDVMEFTAHEFEGKDGQYISITNTSRQILLQMAIPENWNQLKAGKTLKSGFYAPIHGAVERDFREVKQKRSEIYVPFICGLIEDGIKKKSLTDDQAAELVSDVDKKDATCLHLALRCDLNSVDRLINFADSRTLEKQRDNGNTPLHDAVEFLSNPPTSNMPSHSEQPSTPTVPRFLLAAPNCKKNQQCDVCEAADHEFEALRKKRVEVIGKLLQKCPNALVIPNKERMSPYIHYVTAREAFNAKNPNFSIKIEPLDPKKNAPIPPNLTPGYNGTRTSSRPTSHRKGWGANDIVVSRVSEEANVSNSQNAHETADLSPGYEISGPRNISSTGCSLDVLNRHVLADEVQMLLMDRVICSNSFDKAAACLIHSDNTSSSPQRVFVPDGIITRDTPENFINFRYKPMLSYVHLKVADGMNTDDKIPKTADEQKRLREARTAGLTRVFEWLSKEKGVKRILKLVVEEDAALSCSEETVRKCLKMIPDIHYLDWKRPDISVRTLLEAKNIVEVWLYSSGIDAVLAGWGDQNGLKSLEKLRVIHLDAKKGTGSLQECKENVFVFEKNLSSRYMSLNDAPKLYPTFEEPLASNIGRKVQRGDSNADHLKQKNPWLETMIATSGAINSSYFGENQEMTRVAPDSNEYIKVALLDDGVDPGYGGLGKFMSDRGWPVPSEPKPGKRHRKPFYSSGRLQHGNFMAQLITNVCPFARLYVAKIDTETTDAEPRHPTFNYEQAIKAIEWAIAERVDIISMSWNVVLTLDKIEGLKYVIQQAHQEDILLYCAAGDNRLSCPSQTGFWPSICDETCSIGAADEQQKPKEYVSTDANFHFPSDRLDGNNSKDGGNSAATALATGLASLILFCIKTEEKAKNESREEKMKKMDKKTDATEYVPGQFPPVEIKRRSTFMREVFSDLSPRKGSSTFVDISPLVKKDNPAPIKDITSYCAKFSQKESQGRSGKEGPKQHKWQK